MRDKGKERTRIDEEEGREGGKSKNAGIHDEPTSCIACILTEQEDK